MTENPLEGDISASVELTGTGFKGAIKSRIMNAADWVGAKLVVAKFQGRLHRSEERAAANEVRVALIKQSGKIALQALENNPQLAAPLIEAEWGLRLEQTDNKASSVAYTIEDLTSSPPTDEEATSGPERIAQDTLNKWGRYAEEASSDELRQRWGRVLSAEVRRPGTLTPKLLRIIDEIDVETAKEFEALCHNSIVGIIPKCLSGEIDFRQLSCFVQSDLIVDPGISGHIRTYSETKTNDGTDVIAFYLGNYALAWPKTVTVSMGNEIEVFTNGSKGVAIPIYILTDAGRALRQLISTNEEDVFIRIAKLAAEKVPKGDLSVFRRVEDSYVPMSIVGINTDA